VAELAGGVREGEVLAQKYRIERVLGAGAMGVVVAAHHLGLDTKVAIKLLQAELLGSGEAVTRFAREARAAARITSEHVGRVLDVGVLDNGAPFMVMEFLDGVDLHKWLRGHGPLPIEQAVDFVLQASEAIAEAHRLGIVHRDLKPSNLFCVSRPDGSLCIKVLDFGISKMAAGAGSSLSMTGTATVMGTPLYMSPEQMESSRGVDARADVWALGVILFELLTGTSPFYAETLPEVCLKIATRPPSPLQDSRPDVPAELETAILGCLEKDRERRWQTVADFCDAIASFGPARAAASAERILRTMQAPPAAEAAVPDFVRDSRRTPPTPSLESLGPVGHTRAGLARGRPGLLGALGAGFAIAVVISGAFLTRTIGSPARAVGASSAPSVAPTPIDTDRGASPPGEGTSAAPGAVSSQANAAATADRQAPEAPRRGPEVQTRNRHGDSTTASDAGATGNAPPPPRAPQIPPHPAPPHASSPDPESTKGAAYDDRL
jgi:serine/threonine-protein kinase